MTEAQSGSTTSEAAAVRRVALGERIEGFAVLRQAVRGDDRQQLVTRPDGSSWVTRLVDGRVGISCCISEADADEYFDFCLASPSPRGAWIEVGTDLDRTPAAA